MREKISIAMATYNGEKYIREQIESILCQLEPSDELIVSDDGSKDKTIEIIESFSDTRIKIIAGPQKGVKKNFENAIEKCSGKYIFLSDQDDIWEINKIDSVLASFASDIKVNCVLHDCTVYDSKCHNVIIESFFKYRSSKLGIVRNMYKNSYIGCCMAFRNDVKGRILPIPTDIEMHDQWIGVMCEALGRNIMLKQKLIKYRRHDNNVSSLKHHSIKKMISNRVVFVLRFFTRWLWL